MAEVEYKGIKIGGSKLLLILPLLGTIIGGLWGGFELYNRLLIAEKKLNALNPQSIQNEIVRLTELTDVIKDNLQGEIDNAVDRADDAEELVRTVDAKTADTQRQIRNDVYEMEREMQKRFREMEGDIRDNKKELEDKIQTILENPLNDVE
tara:strand:- start:888 stop:1340 length:453 start_codon:yes stop_codon:yes gene_type:complete